MPAGSHWHIYTRIHVADLCVESLHVAGLHAPGPHAAGARPARLHAARLHSARLHAARLHVALPDRHPVSSPAGLVFSRSRPALKTVSRPIASSR